MGQEVRILRHNNEPGALCVSSYLTVGGRTHTDTPHMFALWKKIGEKFDQFRREVLVKQKFHDSKCAVPRTRSATYASDACMSSRVKYGKSWRISSTVIPEAR